MELKLTLLIILQKAHYLTQNLFTESVQKYSKTGWIVLLRFHFELRRCISNIVHLHD